jgi:hypothetical protein
MKVTYNDQTRILSYEGHPFLEDWDLILAPNIGRGGGPYTYAFPAQEFSYEDLISGKIVFKSKGRNETVVKPLNTLFDYTIPKEYPDKVKIKQDKSVQLKQKVLAKC